jgi:hypothetical protein
MIYNLYNCATTIIALHIIFPDDDHLTFFKLFPHRIPNNFTNMQLEHI